MKFPVSRNLGKFQNQLQDYLGFTMPLYSVRWILMSHRSSNTVPDDNMAYEAKQIQCFRQQNFSSGCPRSADPPSQFKSKAQEPYKGQKEQGEVALGSPANSNIDRASKDGDLLVSSIQKGRTGYNRILQRLSVIDGSTADHQSSSTIVEWDE